MAEDVIDLTNSLGDEVTESQPEEVQMSPTPSTEAPEVEESVAQDVRVRPLSQLTTDVLSEPDGTKATSPPKMPRTATTDDDHAKIAERKAIMHYSLCIIFVTKPWRHLISTRI